MVIRDETCILDIDAQGDYYIIDLELELKVNLKIAQTVCTICLSTIEKSDMKRALENDEIDISNISSNQPSKDEFQRFKKELEEYLLSDEFVFKKIDRVI